MRKFRRLDIFKKVPRDLSEGTNIGGFISILSAILMVYFVVNEVSMFLYPNNVSNISLDEPLSRKQLTVSLYIEFPRFPCELISLDIQDAMMSHQANIGSIKKYRLNSHGQHIDHADFELFRQPDVEKQYKMAEQAFKNQYGCSLKGEFNVKQVPGNFHISSHPYRNIYSRLSAAGILKTLDVSHKIHYLFFGQFTKIHKILQAHPGSQLTALNDHHRLYNMSFPHLYTSHYHLDIVPTVYLSLFETTQSYQYTYMHNTFEVNHMPSLYFNYHVGGVRVSISSGGSRLMAFLLNLCAVVGGIYAIGGLVFHVFMGVVGNKGGYIELGQ